MELPTTPTWQGSFTNHADHVCKDGREVGASSGNIYSYYVRQSLSMGCINADLTAQGGELTVAWGDHDGRIKQVRATVERFPRSAPKPAPQKSSTANAISPPAKRGKSTWRGQRRRTP